MLASIKKRNNQDNKIFSNYIHFYFHKSNPFDKSKKMMSSFANLYEMYLFILKKKREWTDNDWLNTYDDKSVYAQTSCRSSPRNRLIKNLNLF